MAHELTNEQFRARKQWRIDVMHDTQHRINKGNYAEFITRGVENLIDTAKHTRDARNNLKHGPMTVSVIQRDCLEAAADIIKTFGIKPAVLNMASAGAFGGGYLHGAGAQEENIFRRSGCYLNTGRGLLSSNPDEIVVKPDGTYKKEFSDEVRGLHKHVPVFEGVCIKTEEADGYQVRPNKEIFPFFELRSAAQNLSRSSSAPFDELLCERQIRAQFESLRLIDAEAVVLSAFGCGAFQNPPELVAAVYKRVIDDSVVARCPHLKKIVFALINPNHPTGDPGYTLVTFKETLTSASSASSSASASASATSSSSASASVEPAEDSDGLPSTDKLAPAVYMLLSDDSWSKLNEKQEHAYREALIMPGPHVIIEGRSGKYKFTRDGDGNMYYSFARGDTLMRIKEIFSKKSRRNVGGKRKRRITRRKRTKVRPILFMLNGKLHTT